MACYGLLSSLEQQPAYIQLSVLETDGMQTLITAKFAVSHHVLPSIINHRVVFQVRWKLLLFSASVLQCVGVSNGVARGILGRGGRCE